MKLRTVFALVYVVTLVVIVCVGDRISPHDPRARSAVFKDGNTMVTPPFPIGTPGYVLGSDQYGRDIVSRLIVGTRPTILAILVIAWIRLCIGIVVGIIASTAGTVVHRFTTWVITLSQSIPALLSALLVLAFTGTNPKLWMFVVALSWNGWSECAREVMHQLDSMRSRAYFHAALSTGDTRYSIFVRHGGRVITAQLIPMFVRELSNALSILAMVGFLGYFVGGATWIIIAGDAIPIGARSADYPELGLLLATSFERVLRPEYLFVVGSYIALLIVGLQLVLSATHAAQQQRPWLNEIRSAIEWGIVRRSMAWPILLCMVLFVGAIAILNPPPPTTLAMTIPAPLINQRTHPWGMYGGDASQSYRIASRPTLSNPIIHEINTSLHGVPVMSNADTVSVYADENRLLQWHDSHLQATILLPFAPIGNPALDLLGNIVAVSQDGKIIHMDSTGTIQKTSHTQSRSTATSGAVIDQQGNVAVTVIDHIEFFDAHGVYRWSSTAIDGYHEISPVFSPDGQLIMLFNQAFDPVDGGRLPLFAGAQTAQFEGPRLISGADGYLYRRNGHRITQIQRDGFVPRETQIYDWDAAHVTMFYPQISGVTINNVAWHLYSGYGATATFVWLYGDMQYASTPVPPQSVLLGVTDDATAIFCDAQGIRAYAPQQAQAIWSYPLQTSLGQCLGATFSDQVSVVAYSHGLVWQTHQLP